MGRHLLEAKTAKNMKEKMQGLIGSDKPYSIMLITRFGIHTFGLKFPIDVLILDDKNKVMSIKENMKPCRIFLWNPAYRNVLELPAGTVKKKAIKKHDNIDLKLDDIYLNSKN